MMIFGAPTSCPWLRVGTGINYSKYIIISIYSQFLPPFLVIHNIVFTSDIDNSIFIIVITADNGDYKVLCYYVNWSQYRPGNGRYTVDDIDPSLCTHILYAFAKVQGNDLTVYEYNDVSK